MNTHLKLVILDRDGTINRASDEFVKSPDEWHALPGALDAISRLNHAGFHVVLATNQSGLGRGLFDMAALNAVHSSMLKALAASGGRIDVEHQHPVCCIKFKSVTAWRSKVCLMWATACVTCRPQSRPGVCHIWSKPGGTPM